MSQDRIVLLGFLGLSLSLYALYVSYSKNLHKETYSALCDVGPFSCSEVMTSEYSKLFSYHGIVTKGSKWDISNSVVGIVAYSFFILHPFTSWIPLRDHFYLFTSFCAVLSSFYLGYILFFILKDVCIVCTLTYGINLALLHSTYKLYLTNKQKQKSKKN